MNIDLHQKALDKLERDAEDSNLPDVERAIAKVKYLEYLLANTEGSWEQEIELEIAELKDNYGLWDKI